MLRSRRSSISNSSRAPGDNWRACGVCSSLQQGGLIDNCTGGQAFQLLHNTYARGPASPPLAAAFDSKEYEYMYVTWLASARLLAVPIMLRV